MSRDSRYLTPDKNMRLDWWIPVCTLLLTGFGIVMIYSASSTLAEVKFNDTAFFLKRQLARIVICLLFMFAAFKFNYRKLGKLSLPLLALSLILLVVLLIPGVGVQSGVIKGARRWLGFGPLTFQPSDLAKFALVVYAADYLVRKQEKMTDFKEGLLPLLLVFGVFVGLIMLQPDFSTTMAITMVLGIVLFVSNARVVHLGALVGSVIPVAAVFILTADYRMRRFLAFLNPSHDAQGIGYQTTQSLVGLGNGGIFGMGLGQSRQKLFFLPEPYTDYIFSIIGEELGFIGAMAVLALFIILIWRGIRAVLAAPDLFGFLLGTGMVSILGVYTMLNLGVVVGILPSTGLPLPFISYGGSSLIINFVAVGFLMNLSRYQKRAV